MSRNNPYKWLNAIGFIAVIVVNYLSNALPIGGRTNKEVSECILCYSHLRDMPSPYGV